MNASKMLPDLIARHEKDILSDWLRSQISYRAMHQELIRESELKQQCQEFIKLFTAALKTGEDVNGSDWASLREFLDSISRSRALQGFTPTQTAMFVFSLKAPLFTRIGAELGRDADSMFHTISATTEVIDKLGLYTTEVYQKGREEIISRQQQDMLELSTPVVKLWDGILALPMIGTLDSGRTQVVMETLLEKIVETGASVAIIDITGVPTVDTLTAQHLMKTVAAARLMGADCIISGIRPQIAQTIVHLAVDLGNIITKATLADAFTTSLKMLGHRMLETPARPA